jgi:hypothetical protein
MGASQQRMLSVRGLGRCRRTVKLRRTLTSHLPPITDMVRPRRNALRLPSAAKAVASSFWSRSLLVFGKKSQMGGSRFGHRGPETLRDGRWSVSSELRLILAAIRCGTRDCSRPSECLLIDAARVVAPLAVAAGIFRGYPRSRDHAPRSGGRWSCD